MKIKNLFAFLIAATVVSTVSAQLKNEDVVELPQMNGGNTRNLIRIPSVDGLLPLKCDFHIHTVFSDGAVWPSFRVKEAWMDGLDAIAITDHIEYLPNREVLKGDFNESYNIAKKAADDMGFILIKGIEISKGKPFGHMNALFINDANPIANDNGALSVDQALKQGAFILWNHPGWPDDKSTLYPEHEKMIKEGKIHGIEVFNEYEYYPKSFGWCNDYKLAYIGNSDVHSSSDITYGNGNKRPFTIVYAKDRSQEAIKEAMMKGQTVAYFNGQLAGPAELVKKLVLASLECRMATAKSAEITNNSDISFRLNDGKNRVIFKAGKVQAYSVPSEAVEYTVENCHVGNGVKLKISSKDFVK